MSIPEQVKLSVASDVESNGSLKTIFFLMALIFAVSIAVIIYFFYNYTNENILLILAIIELVLILAGGIFWSLERQAKRQLKSLNSGQATDNNS